MRKTLYMILICVLCCTTIGLATRKVLAVDNTTEENNTTSENVITGSADDLQNRQKEVKEQIDEANKQL